MTLTCPHYLVTSTTIVSAKCTTSRGAKHDKLCCLMELEMRPVLGLQSKPPMVWQQLQGCSFESSSKAHPVMPCKRPSSHVVISQKLAWHCPQQLVQLCQDGLVNCTKPRGLEDFALEHEVRWDVDDEVVRAFVVLLIFLGHAPFRCRCPWHRLKQVPRELQLAICWCLGLLSHLSQAML